MEHLKIDVKSWITSKHLPDYQLLILPHQESPSLPFDYDSHGSISFSLCNFLSDRDQRFKEYLNLWVEEEEIKSGAEGSNRMELRIIGLNWGVEERSRSIFESQSIDRSCKIDDEIFNDNKIGAKFENEEEEKRLKSVEGRLNEVFKSVDSWNTKVMIRRPETLPEPFLRPFQNQGGAVGNRPLEYLPDGTIKKTKQERLREEEANKSWFAKYWMYILPFAILVMFGGGGNSFEEAKTESKSTPSSSS
ncbi:hypothetical protein BY996DRAFT_6408987 [Phakopsora pachyrhizi]|nr:hypothetical protein BY996DRAFT_6408987 [Phakopsora pachyrhizi]